MLDNKSKGKADNVQCYEISALMKNGVVNLIAHLYTSNICNCNKD